MHVPSPFPSSSPLSPYYTHTTGVDLQDRLRWYYRPNGNHMWHAKKWTISVYRFVINTAAVQGYITHLMLVRLARAEFDLRFEVWLARRNRLRNTPQLPLPAN